MNDKILWGQIAAVGSIVIFGVDMWLGWLMIAAQIYSLIPPMICGRMASSRSASPSSVRSGHMAR